MISPEYRSLLEQMHSSAPWGTKGYKYEASIREFLVTLPGCKTILDYGSGSESLAKACPDLDIRCYDPGVPSRSALPDPADLVVSTDVLEHIEPEFLDDVLRHISSLAQVGIFLHIANVPAKQILPNGRNAHLIVQRAGWWLKKFEVMTGRWKIRDTVAGSKTLRVRMIRK